MADWVKLWRNRSSTTTLSRFVGQRPQERRHYGASLSRPEIGLPERTACGLVPLRRLEGHAPVPRALGDLYAAELPFPASLDGITGYKTAPYLGRGLIVTACLYTVRALRGCAMAPRSPLTTGS
jgi:hypothetical protein